MYIWYTRGKVEREKKRERESLTVKVAYKRGRKKKVNSI